MADPVVVPLWVPVATAAVGALTVGIFNLATNWQNKRFEERKHHKELMLNIALEQWKQSAQFVIEQSKLGKSNAIMPLETYVIHMTKLSEVLNESNITKDNISKKLSEVHEVSVEVEAFYREEEKKEKDRMAKLKRESNGEV